MTQPFHIYKCRELDRERGKLEQQEKKIIADIKKMAKSGQMVGLIVTYASMDVIKSGQISQYWVYQPPPHKR